MRKPIPKFKHEGDAIMYIIRKFDKLNSNATKVSRVKKYLKGFK